ncbi:aldehyde dehydrogenase [Nibricoccus aquaticus]|uniref:Aldehyde dehydrogenase n=1 Tax=Nibricoccus aquaticus TaxID=2576891 RepID=A0A290QJD3_9BACT|nr:PA2169 family four-helix-bundle protein [Nibricoccus aquaticus]ATC63992.1 aldehyde dehydrogenase [Nibricoccus aquaticus]
MKTTDTSETIDLLNTLIETCKDGCEGFKTAAADSKDSELQAVFHRYSAQRSDFARELRALVGTLGGDPDKHGSVTGALHRGWINIKAAVSSNEPHAVLAEAERGEDAAVSAYRNASEQIYDPAARDLVSRQFNAVKAAHDQIRDLRDSPRYAKK